MKLLYDHFSFLMGLGNLQDQHYYMYAPFCIGLFIFIVMRRRFNEPHVNVSLHIVEILFSSIMLEAGYETLINHCLDNRDIVSAYARLLLFDASSDDNLVLWLIFVIVIAVLWSMLPKTKDSGWFWSFVNGIGLFVLLIPFATVLSLVATDYIKFKGGIVALMDAIMSQTCVVWETVKEITIKEELDPVVAISQALVMLYCHRRPSTMILVAVLVVIHKTVVAD